MLKLPLCPYCGARFLYPDVRKNRKNHIGTCPHCNKEFIIYKKYQIILFLCAFFIMIGFNWFLLSVPSMNIWYLLVFTVPGVVIAYFLIPFVIRYRPLEKKPENGKRKK